MRKELFIILVIFGIFVNAISAFEIKKIVTTSEIIEIESEEGEISFESGDEKIKFEPGEAVYVHVRTSNHCSECLMKIDLKYCLYDPNGNIIQEYFHDCPGHEVTKDEGRGRHGAWHDFVLPLSALPGRYTIKVTIYDTNYNTQKTTELGVNVDYYTANRYLEEADSLFRSQKYEDAKKDYEKTKNEYEKFSVYDKIEYCRKQIALCDENISKCSIPETSTSSPSSPSKTKWPPLGDNPIVVAIMVLGAFITIYMFLKRRKKE